MTKFMIHAAIPLLVACVAYAQTSVDESRPLSPSGNVVIRNAIGSITVNGRVEAEAENKEVHVKGTLNRRVTRMDFTTDEEMTLIDVIIPDRGNDRDADITVTLPPGCNLRVNGVSADITIQNIAGRLVVESVSGDVDVGGTPKTVDYVMVSGDITIGASGAEVEGRTVSGDTDIRGARGVCRAKSVSGDITIEGADIDYLSLDSVSGDIEFTGNLTPDVRADAHTISGEIDLIFTAMPDAGIRVETLSGDIQNDLGPSATRKGRTGPGLELDFRTGSGSGRIRIDTLSGGVSLTRK